MAIEKFYTSGQTAKLLQVDRTSVVKWCRDGLLHTYTTPGAHRRIRKMDLVAFLRKHQMHPRSWRTNGGRCCSLMAVATRSAR